MTTARQHIKLAEESLDISEAEEFGSDGERYQLALAQVHATLAVASALVQMNREAER